MTITCSACDMAYDITTDDTIIACPYCGQRTFSPGADDWGDDEDKDDDAPRALILAEMIAESDALGKGMLRREG